MDFITIGFYACVCALLGALAPRWRRLYVRLGIGAVVGAASAFILPVLRGFMGGY